MAVGGPIHKEAVSTVQVTCTSSSPIALECIKEEQEPEENPQVNIEPLTVVTIPPPPPPTPGPSQILVPEIPTSSNPWAGSNPVVTPLLPNLTIPQGHQIPWMPEPIRGPRRPQAPTKWQEAFNLYTLYEDTDVKARNSYQNGCITFGAVQRIYLSGLQDTRKLTSEGRLALCYLQYMLDYGKYYNYINPYINR